MIAVAELHAVMKRIEAPVNRFAKAVQNTLNLEGNSAEMRPVFVRRDRL
jgi:hypothetical protein